MTSSCQSHDFDALFVSYDSCQTTPKSKTDTRTFEKGKEEEVVAEDVTSFSSPCDSLYQHAIHFARTHGYGFVKFVEKEHPLVDEERAKKLRKGRNYRRRNFSRRTSDGYALNKQDTGHHSLYTHFPAYPRSVRLVSSTCRGLCGGRPRHLQAFWEDSISDKNLMIKNENDIREISHDIKKDLTAEGSLGVHPKYRGYTPWWFCHENQLDTAKDKNISHPKRTPSPRRHLKLDASVIPRNPKSYSRNPKHHSCPSIYCTGAAWCEISESDIPRSKSKVEQLLSENDENYFTKSSPLRSKHPVPAPEKIGCPQDKLLELNNEKLSRTKDIADRHCNNFKNENAIAMKDLYIPHKVEPQKHHFENGKLVKGMSDMIDFQFSHFWPPCDGMLKQEPFLNINTIIHENTETSETSQKRERSVKKTKNVITTNIKPIDKDTTSMYSVKQIYPEKERSLQSPRDAKTEAESSKKCLESGVMNNRKGKQYRLCNSLSATIFRESQLHSASLCAPGKTGSVTPQEKMYVKDASNCVTASEETTNENITEISIANKESRKIFEKIGKQSNCIGVSIPGDDLTVFNEPYNAIDVDLALPSAPGHAHIRQSRTAFPPQLSLATMLRSGQLVTMSGLRAGSCPNLAPHSSKKHRCFSSKSAYVLRKSLSPRPKRLRLKTDSHLDGLICNNGNQTFPLNNISSAVGDYNFRIENSSKAGVRFSGISPELNMTSQGHCFNIQKYITNKTIQSAPSFCLRSSSSSDIFGVSCCQSPRCNFACLLKNLSASETSPSEEGYVLCEKQKCFKYCKPQVSRKNTKWNDCMEKRREMSNGKGDKHENCPMSWKEKYQKPTTALDSNNNARINGENFYRDLKFSQAENVRTLVNSQNQGEHENLKKEGGEIPISDNQIKQQIMSRTQCQKFNFTLDSVFPLPVKCSRSPLWDSMLSRDPMTRKLWSCENQGLRQYQASSSIVYNPDLECKPMPFCSATEKCWHIKPTMNITTQSPGLLESTATTKSEKFKETMSPFNQPCNVINSSHYPIRPGIDTEDRETFPSAITCNDTHDRASPSFAGLYRKLDSLSLHYQNQISQCFQAIGNSLNAGLKELQGVFESHIQRRNISPLNYAYNSDDNRSLKRSKHPCNQVKRKATRDIRLPLSSSLDTAKYYKREMEISGQAINKTFRQAKVKVNAGASSACKIFPHARYKEIRSRSKCDEAGKSMFKKNIVKLRRRRQESPKYKSIRKSQQKVSKAVSQGCASKQNSVLCFCNHKHTRSCRRRRGMEGIKCNMCLLAGSSLHRQGIARALFLGERDRDGSKSSSSRSVKQLSRKRSFRKIPKRLFKKQKLIRRRKLKSVGVRSTARALTSPRR